MIYLIETKRHMYIYGVLTLGIDMRDRGWADGLLLGGYDLRRDCRLGTAVMRRTGIKLSACCSVVMI